MFSATAEGQRSQYDLFLTVLFPASPCKKQQMPCEKREHIIIANCWINGRPNIAENESGINQKQTRRCTYPTRGIKYKRCLFKVRAFSPAYFYGWLRAQRWNIALSERVSCPGNSSAAISVVFVYKESVFLRPFQAMWPQGVAGRSCALLNKVWLLLKTCQRLF